MKMTYLVLLYAPAPKAVQGGGGAQNKAVVNNQNQAAAQHADGFDIIDDMELPASGRGGARGSKYFDERVIDTVEKLGKGQGFVIPFMKLDVKDPAKRQRYATKYRIDEWAQENTAEGDEPAKFSVAILADKGIAVRRDS